MLILTRRINETVMIGDDIKVVVVGIKGGPQAPDRPGPAAAGRARLPPCAVESITF